MYEFIGGIVAGIITSFAGYAIIEGIKNTHYKTRVKTLVKTELENLSKFIKIFLQQTDPQSDSIVSIREKSLLAEANIMLSGVIPRIPYAHFTLFNYNSIVSESKIKTFDGDTLLELEKIFQRIRNYGVLVEFPFYSTKKDDLQNLKNGIDKVLEKIN